MSHVPLHMLTSTRKDALAGSQQGGLPYVHLGRDRYAQLAHAVVQYGVQVASRALYDRRSLLTWGSLPETLRVAMILMWLLPGPGALPLDVTSPPVNSRTSLEEITHAVQDHTVPGRPFDDALRRLSDLSGHLHAPVDGPRQERHPPERLAAVLEDLTLISAAMVIATDETTTPELVRITLHNLIADPTRIADECARLLLEERGAPT